MCWVAVGMGWGRVGTAHGQAGPARGGREEECSAWAELGVPNAQPPLRQLGRAAHRMHNVRAQAPPALRRPAWLAARPRPPAALAALRTHSVHVVRAAHLRHELLA